MDEMNRTHVTNNSWRRQTKDRNTEGVINPRMENRNPGDRYRTETPGMYRILLFDKPAITGIWPSGVGLKQDTFWTHYGHIMRDVLSNVCKECTPLYHRIHPLTNASKR